MLCRVPAGRVGRLAEGAAYAEEGPGANSRPLLPIGDFRIGLSHRPRTRNAAGAGSAAGTGKAAGGTARIRAGQAPGGTARTRARGAAGHTAGARVHSSRRRSTPRTVLVHVRAAS